MSRYIIRRLIYSVVVIIGVSLFVFVITHLVGDPVAQMLPIGSPPEEYDRIRHLLGLDRPVSVQLYEFMRNALKGDFGYSYWQRQPALPIVLERLPATFLLVFTAFAIAIFVSIPLGVLASLRPGSLLDRLCVITSLIGMSVPEFCLGFILIIIFAVKLGWLRTSGYGGVRYLILPAVALSGRYVGRLTQIVRSSMIDEMNKPYMVTARAKGLTESAAIVRHALRNAAIPVVTLAGWSLGRLMGGLTVLVETVFAWPGVGLLAAEAISRRDFPLLQADVFVVALLITSLNLIVDILYAFVDPRVKYE
jgi:peptide/nickel transport system permease protein